MLKNSLSSGVRQRMARTKKVMAKAMAQIRSKRQSLPNEAEKRQRIKGMMNQTAAPEAKAMAPERQQERMVDFSSGKPSR